jgi:hypothetical protein
MTLLSIDFNVSFCRPTTPKPTQFVMFTISAIVGSAILYQDFANMDAHQLINFLFGCMTTFAGVFFLTRHKEEEEQGEGKVSHAESGATSEESETVTGSQAGKQKVNLPVNVPRRARPISMGGRKGSRAVTTGSVPTIANLQGHSAPGNVATALLPVNSSLTSTNGSAPKYIVTRRSIFNPAFPVAFIESRENRRF